MSPVMARAAEASGVSLVLYMALELSEEKWVLAFTVGLGQQPRKRAVAGGQVAAVAGEVEAAKRRFRLAADARVVSCYEAGLEGFWLHRALVAQGIENRVVDSASIDVKRGRKHAKTDRLDAGQLVKKLVHSHTYRFKGRYSPYSTRFPEPRGCVFSSGSWLSCL